MTRDLIPVCLLLAISSTTSVFAAIDLEEVPLVLDYAGESWGASWGSLNGDTCPDLFVSNHRRPPSVLINDGAGGLVDRSAEVDGSGTWSHSPNADTHGGSFADFDNDGDQDLYVTAGAKDINQFFVNQGGVLYDHTEAYDPLFPGWRARLPVWLDYTGDGFLDVAVASESDVTVLEQEVPGPGLRDATAETGIQCDRSQTLLLADVAAGDGLELICVDSRLPARIYRTDSLPFTELSGIMPTIGMVLDVALADLDNDLKTDLFAVRGGKRLSGAAQIAEHMVEAQLIVESAEKRLELVSGGGIDVYLATDYVLRNDMIHIGAAGDHPGAPIVNQHEIRFSLTPEAAGGGLAAHVPGEDRGIYIAYDEVMGAWQVAHSPGGEWSYSYLKIATGAPIDALRFLGESELDRPTAPVLLVRDGDHYIDRTLAAGLANPVSCVAAAAGDFDNDMDVDLYLVCRGAVENLANLVYENRGDGTFSIYPDAGAAGLLGYGVGKGENVAIADYDGNGFLDLLIANGLQMDPPPPNDIGGPYQLFRNLGNGNHWIELDLQGIDSNRDAIGAKVYVTAGGRTQLREQNGGYHRWSQHHARIHFGLAKATRVDQVRVVWPSGAVDVLGGLEVNQLYRITEGGAVAPLPSCIPQPPTCGKPDFESAKDAGLFLWKSCDQNLWQVRATAGGSPEPLSYKGALIASGPLEQVRPLLTETSDVVRVSNLRVDFELNVVGRGIDGLLVRLPQGATLGLELEATEVPVRVGPKGTLIQPPCNLAHLAACAITNARVRP